jgi:type IV pilus assembly protein PilX
MNLHRSRLVTRPRRQAGVVLFIALIVLVAMTLAGLATMRSVGTSVLIAGNIAFKRSTLSVSDFGTEKAISWLTATGTTAVTLLSDDPTVGYYSYWMYDPNFPSDPTKTFNPNTFDWAGGAMKLDPATTPGLDPSTTIYYVIHRMCQRPNVSYDDPGPPAQRCVRIETLSGSGSTKGALGGGIAPVTTKSQLFYRITVRAVGPKNTITYTQATVH